MTNPFDDLAEELSRRSTAHRLACDAAEAIAGDDEQSKWESKFPVGSWVRENRQGSQRQQVRMHRGNMLVVGNNDLLHATKAVAD